MQIDIAGEAMLLDHRRALLWPRRRTLVVADVHLGKGSAFRRAGVPVPSGSTRDDLARLSALIDEHRAERLLVLGDLFHAQLQAHEPWFADMERFTARHPALEFRVVRGNHDRIAGVPAHWRIQWREAPLVDAPFVFMHDAAPSPLGYALGGHLHPVTTLRDAHDKLRLPVFWLRAHYGVLPSFGAFTGGFEARASRDDRLAAVTPERVIALPRTCNDAGAPQR